MSKSLSVIVVLLCLLTANVYAEFEFEKSKYKPSLICKEMLGVWYTDTSVESGSEGLKRDITKVDRKLDGTFDLKGVSIHFKTLEISEWQFSGKWSCDSVWYVEVGESSYTALKIVYFGKDKNVLFDERNRMNALKAGNVIETEVLKNFRMLKNIPKMAKFFGLK